MGAHPVCADRAVQDRVPRSPTTCRRR